MISHWPTCGTSLLFRRGDVLEVRLEADDVPPGDAWLRTNLGRAAVHRREVIEHTERQRPRLARDWHDVPMVCLGPGRFRVRLPLLEVGAFEAKAFLIPAGGKPVWPAGDNLRIKVMAAHTVCANTIYTAFPRQFGPALRGMPPPAGEVRAADLLDTRGYTVIPPSGTFRDLIRHLDHIMGEMGFRIIQLLPVHPVPTTFARLGRFGSPFAACDFFGVDPGMAEFDRKATPMAQFEELLDAVHARGGYLFLDLPANHTGWASWLQLHHPEWFARHADGAYVNPGAWGVVWEDLCKLDFSHWELCRYLADVFGHWCRKGVDGFRCDAGYMVPAEAWRYITAKVRDEFPDTVFLLEGLGGPQEVSEELLVGGGLDWAYSELFQAYTAEQVRACLELTTRLSHEAGTMVHFAETHDNNRLAANSVSFARFRAALCALLSHDGSFGITNGLEWFATEKLDVHGASSLNWGVRENQVQALRQLLALLREQPAFWAGSSVEPVDTSPAGTVGFVRRPRTGPPVLVLANLGEGPVDATWPAEALPGSPAALADLVCGEPVAVRTVAGRPKLRLAAQTALCLGTGSEAIRIAAPTGGQGHAEALVPEAVLRQEFQALALELLVLFPRPGELSAAAVAVLGAELRQAPDRFLAAHCTWAGTQGYVPAVHWRLGRDERRDVPLPPGHLLVVDAGRPFIMAVHESGRCLHRRRSLPAPGGSHFAVLLPLPPRPRTACLELDLCVAERPVRRVRSGIVLLPSVPGASIRLAVDAAGLSTGDHCAVCSDSLGAMALVRGRWGEVRSQYDALLAANLSSTHPVDRQVLLTRCRAWIVHRDYSQEVGPGCQVGFSTDLANRVQWDFRVPVGLGLQIPLRIVLEMAASGNAVRLRFERPGAGMLAEGLDDQTPVALILRPDIEDRCCHQVTRAYTGPEQAFQEAVRAVAAGFRFDPSGTHALLCTVSQGEFVLEPEWHYRVPYPVEAARGLSDAGDLFSPGYFRCPLAGGDAVVVSASCGGRPGPWPAEPVRETVTLPIEETARRALSRFVVRRDASRSVVAGYPWFLDWGRDTLICLRGIIAGGRLEEARDIIGQFARFERGGTLPNMIRGSDASDRDTSDAPFWLSVAVADYLRAAARPDILDLECGGRPLRQVLAELATAVVRGTENGIRMDPESGLVFSPAHFTWMDTNHPAATPRQGYPIEVQALWHAALRLLAAIGAAGMPWEELAARVRAAVSRRYPLGAGRGLSDCLEAEPGTRAQDARADDACRPNQLLAVTLGLVEGPVARSVVEACWPLLVPTGIRSLADQPVAYPLAVRHQGRLLNDPLRPYWGRYEGDEDTRRKPAYHNGTAWTWLLPSFAEALVSVYGPGAREPARSLLSGMASCMESGCLGHVPELTDGDAPHRPRGCVAQAWGVSELLRVLLLLRDETPASQGVSKQQGGAVSP